MRQLPVTPRKIPDTHNLELRELAKTPQIWQWILICVVWTCVRMDEIRVAANVFKSKRKGRKEMGKPRLRWLKDAE
jgi:hypothetical protein